MIDGKEGHEEISTLDMVSLRPPLFLTLMHPDNQVTMNSEYQYVNVCWKAERGESSYEMGIILRFILKNWVLRIWPEYVLLRIRSIDMLF
jgi:hypothetical protein